MAEGTYDYECMRAELLGLSKPDEKEFYARQQERLLHQDEELEGKTLEVLENENDDLKNVSGGLEELNSILSRTQKKLNRFKSACGSLTNLLKIKVGNSDSTESISMKESEDEKSTPDVNDTESPSVSAEDPEVPVQNGARKSDLAKALDNQVGKLDQMVMRAENAQYTMGHQNKQMRTFLKK